MNHKKICYHFLQEWDISSANLNSLCLLFCVYSFYYRSSEQDTPHSFMGQVEPCIGSQLFGWSKSESKLMQQEGWRTRTFRGWNAIASLFMYKQRMKYKLKDLCMKTLDRLRNLRNIQEYAFAKIVLNKFKSSFISAMITNYYWWNMLARISDKIKSHIQLT